MSHRDGMDGSNRHQVIWDANGFLGWMKALDTDAFDIQRVAGAFVNSQEFQQTYGTLDNGAFVDLLYQNVLGRQSGDRSPRQRRSPAGSLRHCSVSWPSRPRPR